MTLGFIKFFKHAPLSAAQKFWSGGKEKGYFPHLYNMEGYNMLECKKWLNHLPDLLY